MYMSMLGLPENSFAQQIPMKFGQFLGMSSQQQIAFPFTPTAPNTSVQPSNNSISQGTSSFNPWDPYIQHE